MATKVCSRIDDLGFVHIPEAIKAQFRLVEGDSVVWSVDGDLLKLSKFYLLDQIKFISQDTAHYIGAKLH
jgi:bifunctional DNA-binding transcriptional regulator/antitoxin component of YhaV-PrlF toxin-antitoxin module